MAVYQYWKSALDDVTKGSASLVGSRSSFKKVMNLYDTLAIMKILFINAL